MLTIPEQWKSKRQRIVEVYIYETKNVNEITKRLQYKYPSFVRMVVHEYREFLKTEEMSPQLTATE